MNGPSIKERLGDRMSGLERPLHSGLTVPGAWWACEYPERPRDPWDTAYDMHCPKCRMKCRADIMADPEDIPVFSTSLDRPATLLEVLDHYETTMISD